MRDSEMKDIDKLKNLLNTFMIKFKQSDYEDVSYIDLVHREGELYTTAFAFTSSGKFSNISEG